MVVGWRIVQLRSDFQRAKKLARRIWRGRKAARHLKQLRAETGPLQNGVYEIGVYFADSDVNIYQMRQWYGPLQALAKQHPVLLIARNAIGAKTLTEESGLPVAFAPKISHLETLVGRQPLKVVLYVNQNTRNFQMMRYGRRFHVFINHGESDKMYMTSNQHKAYDFAFVAGDAARERLSKALWDYDVDERTFTIGRPQTDHLGGQKPYPDDDRITVLYAPTWEGDRPAATYGSVRSHGETLVEALLQTGRHRVIYRPHPRSGVVDPDFGSANERIIAKLKAANAKDPQAHHIYDTAAHIGWQLSEPDVAICDVSAMVYDRLATGKPLMVTRPENPEAEVDETGYLSQCEWLSVDQAVNIVAEVERVISDETARKALTHWSEHYFGDTAQGAPTQRFHDAVAKLFTRWEKRASQTEAI